MVLEIPTTELADYEEQVTLDGLLYTLRFRFNPRCDAWFLDISDGDGAPIVMGRKLVVDFPFTAQHGHREGIVQGEIFVYDTSLRKIDPRFGELGERVLALYLERAEIETL